MSIFEWAVGFCTERGIEERNAVAVIEKVVLHPGSADIRQRWGDEFERYLDPIKRLLVRTNCQCALEWIEIEEPSAYYRSLFDGAIQPYGESLLSLLKKGSLSRLRAYAQAEHEKAPVLKLEQGLFHDANRLRFRSPTLYRRGYLPVSSNRCQEPRIRRG
jgi:hypothetical protein